MKGLLVVLVVLLSIALSEASLSPAECMKKCTVSGTPYNVCEKRCTAHVAKSVTAKHSFSKRSSSKSESHEEKKVTAAPHHESLEEEEARLKREEQDFEKREEELKEREHHDDERERRDKEEETRERTKEALETLREARELARERRVQQAIVFRMRHSVFCIRNCLMSLHNVVACRKRCEGPNSNSPMMVRMAGGAKKLASSSMRNVHRVVHMMPVAALSHKALALRPVRSHGGLRHPVPNVGVGASSSIGERSPHRALQRAIVMHRMFAPSVGGVSRAINHDIHKVLFHALGRKTAPVSRFLRKTSFLGPAYSIQRGLLDKYRHQIAEAKKKDLHMTAQNIRKWQELKVAQWQQGKKSADVHNKNKKVIYP